MIKNIFSQEDFEFIPQPETDAEGNKTIWWDRGKYADLRIHKLRMAYTNFVLTGDYTGALETLNELFSQVNTEFPKDVQQDMKKKIDSIMVNMNKWIEDRTPTGQLRSYVYPQRAKATYDMKQFVYELDKQMSKAGLSIQKLGEKNERPE